MKYLSLKIPPVGVFIIAMGLIFACSQWVGWAQFEFPLKIYMAGICILFAGYLGLGALFEFFRVKTTVDPVNPERASIFVTRGVYRFSRNPMYLGLGVLLIGYAYWLGNLMGFVCVWGFVIYMNQFQIVAEERAMGKLFGEPYQLYKTQVRRWI